MTPTVEAPTLADSLSRRLARIVTRSIISSPRASSGPTGGPASPRALFLDMSGEEVRQPVPHRRRRAGEEMCLRPEYTIPVCPLSRRIGPAPSPNIPISARCFVPARARASRPRRGSSFGRKDAEAADAEVFALSLEAATAARAARSPARRRRPIRGGASIARGSRRLAAPSAPRPRRPRARPRRHPEPASQGAGGRTEMLAALESADHAQGQEGAGRGSSPQSPASRRSAAAAPARSPTGFSSRLRCARASVRPRNGRCWKRSWRFPAIRTQRRSSWRPGPVREPRPCSRARLLRNAQRLHRRPGDNNREHPLRRRLRARLRLLHRLRVRAHDSQRRAQAALTGGHRYDGLARRLGAERGHSRRQRRDHLDRLANEAKQWKRQLSRQWRHCRSPPRDDCKEPPQRSASTTKQNAAIAAGSPVCRGSRSPMSRSTAETVGQLSPPGQAHFGVAGEDLVREKSPGRRRPARASEPARLRPPMSWSPRRGSLDRRALDKPDPERCRLGLPRQRRADAGGDHASISPAASSPSTVSPTIVSSRASARPRARHRADQLIVDITTTGSHARGKRSSPRRRGNPALAGDADRVADRAVEAKSEDKSRARHPRPDRRKRGRESREVRARLPSPAHLIVQGHGPRPLVAVSATGEDVDPHGFVALHCARGESPISPALGEEGAERVGVAASEQFQLHQRPLPKEARWSGGSRPGRRRLSRFSRHIHRQYVNIAALWGIVTTSRPRVSPSIRARHRTPHPRAGWSRSSPLSLARSRDRRRAAATPRAGAGAEAGGRSRSPRATRRRGG